MFDELRNSQFRAIVYKINIAAGVGGCWSLVGGLLGKEYTGSVFICDFLK